ncbi:hypothetical protein NUACC26_056990 [Scytonema sp. NUACC26]
MFEFFVFYLVFIPIWGHNNKFLLILGKSFIKNLYKLIMHYPKILVGAQCIAL